MAKKKNLDRDLNLILMRVYRAGRTSCEKRQAMDEVLISAITDIKNLLNELEIERLQKIATTGAAMPRG